MKSRRSFIKEMLLIGIASGLSLMSKVVSLTGAAKTPKWTMIIDLNKCIACGLCVMACTRENTSYMGVEIPLESRTRIYIVEWNGEKIPMHILCRQCTDAPCVSVCPTGASHKTAEGIVLIDHDLCIGCKYCLSVCPFDARYINEDLKAADKCTWCYHRIIKGLQPACVCLLYTSPSPRD